MNTKSKVKARNKKCSIVIFVILYDVMKIFWAITIVMLFWTILSAKTNQERVNLVNGNIHSECRLKSVKSRSSINELFKSRK